MNELILEFFVEILGITVTGCLLVLLVLFFIDKLKDEDD